MDRGYDDILAKIHRTREILLDVIVIFAIIDVAANLGSFYNKINTLYYDTW